MYWHEKYPQILQREINTYKEKGLDFVMNEPLLLSRHIVVFDGIITDDADNDHHLQVSYPTMFPLVGVQVSDLSAVFDRHQNPRERNLCLPRWINEETGADKVIQAINLINLLIKGRDAVRPYELHEPEPVSTWYKYTAGANLLIPEKLIGTNTGKMGQFKLRLGSHLPIPDLLQAVLTEIEDRDTGSHAASGLGPFGAAGGLLEGKWFRCSEHPPFHLKTYDDWYDWLSRVSGEFVYQMGLVDKQRRRDNRSVSLETFAIVYPEEGPAYDQYHDQWQVCIRRYDKSGARGYVLKPYILPASDSYFRRFPLLSDLRDKHATILGLGAIGSIVAEELARAGVGSFSLIDHDILQPGNIVRHSCDLRSVGVPKVAAVAHQLWYINPACNVEMHGDRIGAAPVADQGNNDIDMLSEVLGKSDILISALGNLDVEFWVSDMAVERQLPAIYAAVFYGAWAGQVFRSRPGGPCFRCYQRSSKYGDVTMPQDKPALYLDGCSDPSFPGAGFDSSIIANLAVRLAVQTLLPDRYPDVPYDLISWCSRGELPGAYPQIRFDSVERRVVCLACNPAR